MKNFRSKFILHVLCFCVFLYTGTLYAQSNRNIFSFYSGLFFGQKLDTIASIFAPNTISTSLNEINATFSSDGNEFYYSLGDPGYTYYAIHISKKINNKWTQPEVAPFSGCYSDADPCFSPDGKKLFFISKRPIKKGDTIPKKDFDIWSVTRTANGWGEPVHLDTTINTNDHQFYVAVTNDESIYYATQGKIRKAVLKNGTYETHIINMGDSTYKASKVREGDMYVDPSERFLIASISGEKSGLGAGDLYISFNKNGVWSTPENLGPQVNSADHEFCPMLSPDGKYLFFTSNKGGSLVTSSPKNHKDIIRQLNKIENGNCNIYSISFDYIKNKFNIK